MSILLEQTGYTDVAKAYILYRKQREKIRNMKNTILDYKDVVNSYVEVEDSESKGKFHSYLFRRRTDYFKQLRRSYCQLLAV